MTFEQCIPHILHWEGGYVNDPNDPGGETAYGISKRSYPGLDIKKITVQDAVDIYRRDFWDATDCGTKPKQLRLAYFDCCVNQGPGAAVRFLQSALGVTADGVIGPYTRAALAQANGETLTLKFLALRMAHYTSLGTWSRYGAGWTNRLLYVTLETGKGY